MNSPGAKRMRWTTWRERPGRIVALGVSAAIGLAAIAWVRRSTDAAAASPVQDPPVIVEMALAERRDVPVNMSTIGTVQAYNTVLVRPRVDGRITRIGFTEGDEVEQGQVLAEIDPRPLQAEARHANAVHAGNVVRLDKARRDLERVEAMVKQQLVAAEAVDAARAEVAALEEDVAAAAAERDRMQVQLAETQVRAPLSGRTGMRLVDAGNVILADDERGLVTIAQIHPINVVFSLPSELLDSIRANQHVAPLQVSALSRDGATVLAQGKLTLIDNQVDTATATVKLKAAFANTEDALWPGQFVNVRLLVQTRAAQLVVPMAAVQEGPHGRYVFLVDDGYIVHMQAVTVSSCSDGWCIVGSGLEPGAKVVVDGQHKVEEGVLVAAPPAAKAPDSPDSHTAATQ